MSEPSTSALSSVLHEAGLTLYSQHQQTEAFFALFCTAVHAHRQMQFEAAASALSTIVNLVQWPAEQAERQMMADVLRAHQQELLDYSQYVTAGLRLAGLLGDRRWATHLADISVGRQAYLAEKVTAAESVKSGAVPTLVIAGFMKCATTALHDFLVQQPWAMPAAAKEVGWLGAPWGRGLGAGFYKRCFPAQAPGWDSPPFSVDAYPRYITNDGALDAIARLKPVPLVVVLVRDPFDRFVSNFEHDLRLGIDRGHRSVAEYAESVVDRLQLSHSQAADGHGDDYLIPFTESLYVPWITRWMHRLGRQRLSVLDLTDLVRSSAMQSWLRDFVGREGDPRVNVPWRNVNPAQKALAVEPGSALDIVRRRLLEANRDLPDLIGRHLPWAGGTSQ